MRSSHDTQLVDAPSCGAVGKGLPLRVDDLRKQFGPTKALNGLSFGIETGAVHALLGENGAGKSTLVKLLSGLLQPDSGEIRLFGERTTIANPRQAHGLGIRTAFQEISLVKDLTVAQNFVLLEEPLVRLGVIPSRRTEEFVREQFSALGLGEIDPRLPVSRVDLPTRQKIEIARAVNRNPRLLILDEPTASLSARDVVWLGEQIARARAHGATVILISHRMQDVRDFCSELTVLRGGVAVGTYAVNAMSDEDVIELMIGRSIDVVFPPKPVPAAGHSDRLPALTVKDFMTQGVEAVSFDLQPGEIIGLAALQGMGQRELFLGLFGAQPAKSGTFTVNGDPCEVRSPADAINPRIGIGLVPEDRKTEGLFLDLDGKDNTTLSCLDMFQHLGLIEARTEWSAVQDLFNRLNVALKAMWSPVRQLSGGNQQKVILAKWLMTGGKIMLFYDPTRGVDVGTKAEIYRIMREYADDGGAIFFYSTDITELVNLCDEVLILYRGRIAERLAGEELTETNIMRAVVGHGVSEKASLHGHPVH